MPPELHARYHWLALASLALSTGFDPPPIAPHNRLPAPLQYAYASHQSTVLPPQLRGTTIVQSNQRVRRQRLGRVWSQPGLQTSAESGCPYHKLVVRDILEEIAQAWSSCGSMFTVLVSLVGAALSFLKTQQELALENLALRHQIGVLKRTLVTKRVCFKPSDRRLWVMLFRLWSGWQQALAIVQPATVIRWHRSTSSSSQPPHSDSCLSCSSSRMTGGAFCTSMSHPAPTQRGRRNRSCRPSQKRLRHATFSETGTGSMARLALAQA